MRPISVLLAAAGLVVGVVLPVFGLGLLPLIVGAVCLAAAGLVAQRGWPFGLAGIAAAVLLLVAPGVITRVGNGRGIAWAVPEGESVVLAEHGFAVTRDEDGYVVRGRDLATGDERWRLRLPTPQLASAQFGVQRVGDVLIVHDRGGQLSGVDLATGKQLWRAPGGRAGQPALATPEVFVAERCDDGCVVEARSVKDGTLRWRADSSGDGFLGAPHTNRGNVWRLPLWPSETAVLRSGERDQDFEVRDIATGRVLRRGGRDDGATAVNGHMLVHAVYGGDLWATDARSGRELWRRRRDGDRVARSANALLTTVGMPDGSLVLSRHGDELPSLIARDELQLVDPRTGELSVRPKRLEAGVRIIDSLAPEITAETAARGVAARVPILVKSYDDEGVQADGRLYEIGDLEIGSVAATPTQVGWESDQPSFGHKDRDGAEVHDRRSGKRLVRYVGDDVDILAVGERLVISVGDEDDEREYVVAP